MTRLAEVVRAARRGDDLVVRQPVPERGIAREPPRSPFARQLRLQLAYTRFRGRSSARLFASLALGGGPSALGGLLGELVGADAVARPERKLEEPEKKRPQHKVPLALGHLGLLGEINRVRLAHVAKRGQRLRARERKLGHRRVV